MDTSAENRNATRIPRRGVVDREGREQGNGAIASEVVVIDMRRREKDWWGIAGAILGWGGIDSYGLWLSELRRLRN